MDTLERLARASKGAYQGREGLPGYEWAYECRGYLGVQAYVCAAPPLVDVVFRGTDEWADWWANVRYWFPRRLWNHVAPGAVSTSTRAHRGYCNAVESVVEDVRDCLRAVSGAEVSFTGHSLGGAMAIVLSLFVRPERIVTFGSPRCVDSGYPFGDRLTRYVYDDDLVPKLMGMFWPARWWYADVGRRISLPDFDDRFLDGISDHSMEGYLQCVLSRSFSLRSSLSA